MLEHIIPIMVDNPTVVFPIVVSSDTSLDTDIDFSTVYSATTDEQPLVFPVTFSTSTAIDTQIDVAITHGSAIKYDGDYVVVPKKDSQTILDTNGKIMTDDVTVLKIPYYETANEHGDTVYIASEV